MNLESFLNTEDDVLIRLDMEGFGHHWNGLSSGLALTSAMCRFLGVVDTSGLTMT